MVVNFNWYNISVEKKSLGRALLSAPKADMQTLSITLIKTPLTTTSVWNTPCLLFSS